MRAVKEKDTAARWARRYQTSLRKYIAQGAGASLRAAATLGRQAVALGLETLDLARIHERVRLALVPPGDSPVARRRVGERAANFFAETIVPIEGIHRAAIVTGARVKRLARALARRTAQSSASTRRLRGGVVRRRVAEAALAKSREDRATLSRQSSRLQGRLRREMRRLLSMQEKERLNTSHQLHDGIAQTLVAINLRLLSLKTAAMTNTDRLEKEIAATRLLVRESVSTIRRLANELGVRHET